MDPHLHQNTTHGPGCSSVAQRRPEKRKGLHSIPGTKESYVTERVPQICSVIRTEKQNENEFLSPHSQKLTLGKSGNGIVTSKLENV